MKIAVLADVHIGNHRQFGGEMRGGINHRASLILSALTSAIQRCKKDEIDDFVIAGDVFDHARPSPQLVAGLVRAVRAFNYGPRVHLVVGNHDMSSTHVDDHSCASIDAILSASTFQWWVTADSRTVRSAAAPRAASKHYDNGVVLRCVAYHPGKATTWLQQHARLDDDGPSCILVSHAGVYDDSAGDTPVYLSSSRDAVPLSLVEEIMRANNYEFAAFGNWHDRRAWGLKDGRMVAIPGSLCPVGFGESGLTGHGYVVWDTGAKSLRGYEVPGPRFVALEYGDDGLDSVPSVANRGPLDGVWRDEDQWAFYVRWTVPSDQVSRAREALDEHRRLGESFGYTADGIVVPCSREAEVAARRAAGAARNAEFEADALSAYVLSMDLPTGARPEVVLDLAKTYLKKARSGD